MRNRLESLLVAVWLCCPAAAVAQVPSISGEWSTSAAIYGQMNMTLRQDGATVAGTYGGGGLPGKISGSMEGNVLRGTFSDLGASGTFVFQFSPDGSRFQGNYTRGGRGANGSLSWNGTKIGPVALTPAEIIEQRADLTRVVQSGASPEEQARTACNNLMSNTFARDGDVLRTRLTVAQGSFAPVLGAPQQATLYLEFAPFSFRVASPIPLSDTDRRNGWQYSQRIELLATSFQLGQQVGGQNWRNLGSTQPVIACIFSVRNNRTSITVEKPIERLTMQGLPDFSSWSRP